MTENTEKKQGGRFKPGLSGNPAGRPKGGLGKRTLLLQQVVDDAGQEIVGQLVGKAKMGIPWALKLCAERLLPPLRVRPLDIDITPPADRKGMAEVTRQVLAAVADGDMSSGEAEKFLALAERCLQEADNAKNEIMFRL